MQKLPVLKRNPFRAIYLSAVIALLAALALWLFQLHGMLAAYEASMPQHAARRVADALSGGDYRILYEHLGAAAQGETEAQFERYLRDRIGGRPVDCVAAYARGADAKIYNLEAGGEPFAALTLAATADADAYGNRGWAVRSASLTGAPRVEYVVTVPDESAVYADDLRLGEEYVLERDIPMDCAGHLPAKKVHVPTWTRYRVARSFSAPQFRVVDRNGRDAPLVSVGENEYRSDLSYDDAVRKSQGKRAAAIAKAYGLFSIGRMGKGQFLGYVLNGTAAYNMIHKYDERWFVKNSGYRFENVKAEKFYPYSKDCYSCEVTYDMVLKAGGGKTETYPTKLTLYLYRSDKFKVYDMVIGQ